MIRNVVCLLLCFTSLVAEKAHREDPELTSLVAEPSTIIGGHVNVLTGDFQDFEEDLHVVAPEALHVQRCYCSSAFAGGIFEHNWSSNHQAFFRYSDSWEDLDGTFHPEKQEFTLPLGQTLKFFPKKGKSQDQKVKISKEFLAKGFTNTAQGLISAQTNPNNLTWVVQDKVSYVKFGSGRVLKFEKSVITDQLPSGNRLEYFKDEHPRRKVVLYDSKNKKMGGVVYDGPNSAKNFRENPHVIATTPDGRTSRYQFSLWKFKYKGDDSIKAFYLKSVTSSDKPLISYSWELIPYSLSKDVKLSGISRPEGRNLSCRYYKPGQNNVRGCEIQINRDDFRMGRVAVILEPIGSGPELLPRYQFFYARTEDNQEGCTGVYDALGYKTDYSYNAENRLKRITRYDAHQNPYSQEILNWGEINTRQQTHLKARSFVDLANHQILFNKAYHYDVKGNVTHEILSGNITGYSSQQIILDSKGYSIDNGVDRQYRSYDYSDDDFNLLLSERIGSFVKKFTYQPGSNRLLSCLHQESGAIFLRHFYSYDQTGQVIEHIIDDGTAPNRANVQGVTERRYERIKRSTEYPFGLPLEVEESYWDADCGSEKLIRRTINEYNVLGQVTKKTVYGEDNNLFSVELWSYDGHGNVLCHTNALGEQWTYRYDANDNRIFEEAPDGSSVTRYHYDYMNRLIVTEHISDGLTLTERTHYDLAGNPVASVDIYGNKTEYTFDAFHRVVEVKGAPVEDLDGNLYRPITQTVYNPLSLPVRRIDPEGSVTETVYSILGKPLIVSYSDGSQEKFYYDQEGRLVETIAKSGLRTQFILDIQGRPVRTIAFDQNGALLHETHSRYNAFHLLSEIDPLGIETVYSYDGAGRKREEVTADRRTSFFYNPQGLLEKTIVSSIDNPEEAVIHIQLYDALQRVIEERQENLKGEVIQAVRYGYDARGNRIREERDTAAAIAITTIQYDALGIPISRIDPMGNRGVVSCSYDFVNEHGQRVGRIECVDPLGIKTCITQDALGRSVLTEKFDMQGKLIQKMRFWFNSLGKCLQTTTYNPLNVDDFSEQSIRWEYDSSGRVIRQVEGYGTPEQKETGYAYCVSGAIKWMKKPDGVTVHYGYDAAGRLYTVTSPEINYQYSYDVCGRIIAVLDLIQNQETRRSYDDLGRLIHEKLANGLEIHSVHAAMGGMKECQFPDLSKVKYHYNGGRLESVERLNAAGLTLYSHRYLSFDDAGNLLRSSLIHSLGEEEHSYNLNGATVSLQSSYVEERMERNAVGQIVSRYLNGNTTQFSYDPLSQLKEENGLFCDHYECDSRYNRIEKNGKNYQYNSLNQLLTDGDHSYSYDANGNMIAEEKNRYRYDSLNRLIQMECGDAVLEYQYDPFDRCISLKKFFRGELINAKRMIYIGHEEVGSCDDTGSIQELRLLGRGIKSDVGAAISIELKGVVYAPQHDHLGNVIALVDTNGKVCESYSYSAFGEAFYFNESHQRIRNSSLGNPWLYSSKRHEGHLIHFGFRFYLPGVGRFITKDPAGYSAGVNPYAYVANHPLHAIDPLGLKEDSINLYDRTHDRSSWECNNRSTDYHERDRKEGEGTSIFRYTSILWRHLVPIPILQDMGCSLMHYLDQGTISAFRPWRFSKTSIATIPGEVSKRIAYVLIGGINTSHDELMSMAINVSNMYGGVQLTVIHNGDHGMVADLLECFGMICNFSMHSVNKTYKELSKQLASVGGVEGNGMVKLTLFSQGALTGEKALKKMTQTQRGRFHINTYGPASIISEDGYLYSKNSISNLDFIPLGASLPSYLSARFGWMREVEFLPARESVWGVDHRFESETYQRAMQQDADAFIHNYGDLY